MGLGILCFARWIPAPNLNRKGPIIYIHCLQIGYTPYMLALEDMPALLDLFRTRRKTLIIKDLWINWSIMYLRSVRYMYVVSAKEDDG